MDNLTAGNPRAHRIRVHFNTASTLISEGMPVCYSFDSTANWWGGSVSNGEVTAATTVTEGALNPIRYIRVEKADADNVHAFAGVVAKGGWCGKTTSATANVGQLLDIYVPNGAVVPVLADQACVMGRTILAVHTGELHLTAPHGTASHPVAIAWETNAALSGDAGLILAKLDESLFIHQQGDADNLLVDDVDTGSWMRINTIQCESTTDNWVEVMNVTLELAGTCTGKGAAFVAELEVGKTTSGDYSSALVANTNFGAAFGSTAAVGGGNAAEFKLSATASADLELQKLAVLKLNHMLPAAGITGPNWSCMIQLNCTDGANKPDYFIYAQNIGSIGYTASGAETSSKTGAIKLHIDGTKYLRVYDDFN